MDDLPLLKDIHLPDPVTKFPLGYGVIGIMIFLGLIIIFLPYFKYLYFQSKKYYALQLLKKQTAGNVLDVRHMSELLRRICKVKYKEAVALYGQQWAAFLNGKTDFPLSQKLIDIFINAPYISDNFQIEKKDFDEIYRFVVRWVEVNL